MFRSFFPEPKLFFPSAVVWLLLTTLLFFTVGDTIRNFVSLDHFLAPTVCTTEDLPNDAELLKSETATPQASSEDCVESDDRFLNGEKIWLYQYVLMTAFLFCVFWYFFKRNEWYRWSVVGSTSILLVIYFNVQVDAWINDWSGVFFNLLQQALSEPGSVDAGHFYGQMSLILFVLVPNILVLVLLSFLTSHYVFRWRTAMNNYYMSHWPLIRTTEGASQRVQEDTMRFATIVEDLGTSFFSSLITLAVFLPLLWGLSKNVTSLPILGDVPGGLVWAALLAAAFGTVLLAGVGYKLPGLNFQNQRVEAAYRKELVYGEDNADRADPPTAKELFGRVRQNYFKLYFHYTYFNLARFGYLQAAGYIPLLALAPSILAGALTLGLYQQVGQAFGQVATSFQFFARAWSTIVELLSVRKRLAQFESHMPDGYGDHQ